MNTKRIIFFGDEKVGAEFRNYLTSDFQLKIISYLDIEKLFPYVSNLHVADSIFTTDEIASLKSELPSFEMPSFTDDEFTKFIDIVAVYCLLPSTLIVILGEGFWYSEVCRIIVGKLKLKYFICEYGPFPDTMILAENGLFLRANCGYLRDTASSMSLERVDKYMGNLRDVKQNFIRVGGQTESASAFIGKSPYIVFFAPYYKWLEWTYPKNLTMTTLVNLVLSGFRASQFGMTHHLYIKFHPYDINHEIVINEPNITLIQQQTAAVEILRNASAIITMQSKVIFEALLNKCKVVNIGQSPYFNDGYIRNIQVESIQNIFKELENLIAQELSEESLLKFFGEFVSNEIIIKSDHVWNEELVNMKAQTIFEKVANNDSSLQLLSLFEAEIELGRENNLMHLESICKKDCYIEDMKKSLTEKDCYIEDMKKSLTEKDCYVEDMKKSLTEKDIYIDDLQNALTLKDEYIEDMKRSTSEKDVYIEDLLNTLTQKDEYIKSIHVAIDQKDK